MALRRTEIVRFCKRIGKLKFLKSFQKLLLNCNNPFPHEVFLSFVSCDVHLHDHLLLFEFLASSSSDEDTG